MAVPASSEGEHSLCKILVSTDRRSNQPYARNLLQWQKMRNSNSYKNLDILQPMRTQFYYKM